MRAGIEKMIKLGVIERCDRYVPCVSTDKIPNIHYNEILIQIVATDIWRNYYTIDKDKTCKTDGIKTIFHNRIQSRLYNEKEE